MDWVPPGPVPPGARDPANLPGPEETLDCLAGHWRIFQLRSGHRYATDDLLTAWYAAEAVSRTTPPPQTCLDLGCGIGSVGLLLLWRFPELRLVGVEAQSTSAELARRNLRYNGVEHRAEVRHADLRAGHTFAGGERFDLITGSPPYLTPGEGRRSSGPQKGPCRFEDRGGVRDYLAVAAGLLKPGGRVVWVHASRYLDLNLEAAAGAQLCGLRVRPVIFREGRTSLVSLFSAGNGNSTSPVCEDELVIRQANGAWSPEFIRIRAEMGFPT